jgi:hypothetical protein
MVGAGRNVVGRQSGSGGEQWGCEVEDRASVCLKRLWWLGRG